MIGLRSGLLWLGGGLAIAYTLTCWYFWTQQTRWIFFPQPTLSRTPGDRGLVYEDVWLDSSEVGVKLHGWWIPNPASDRVLLYLHGNGDNISANAYHAGRFYHLGFSVFIFDYRGYGQSGGSFPSEKTVYEDADRVWQYLVEERGFSPEKIMVYGHSLGGAIAIELATKQPQISGLIIEGSFTSMRDMADYSYPFLNLLPIDQILHNKFDSAAKVSSLKMPLLFIHSVPDQTVPAFMSERLYTQATARKKLWLFPDGDHNVLASTAGAEYFQTIRDFFQLPVFPIPDYYLSRPQ